MDNNMVFESNGNVNIADEVVAVIASLAASEVKGVAGMAGGVAGGFAELLGKKNLSKGVRILNEDGKITLSLTIIVEYGAKIPNVAWEVQEKVKSEVENMTDLEIAAVNVAVEGIDVPAESAPAVQKATEEAEAE